MSDDLLRLDQVSARYRSFLAMDNVSVRVSRGQVIGVIGPNGAGKSTLVNTAAGLVPGAAGTIRLAGRRIDGLSPHRRARLGLRRTFQTAQLFDSLSVYENVAIGRRGLRRPTTRAAAAEWLARVGYTGSLDTVASTLSGGDRKLVEVARAMSQRPRVLLLDEPAAGVPKHQRMVMLQAVRDFVREEQVGALLIEHDMQVISAACDWIYVMDAGSVIAEGAWESISTNPAVVKAYLGG